MPPKAPATSPEELLWAKHLQRQHAHLLQKFNALDNQFKNVNTSNNTASSASLEQFRGEVAERFGTVEGDIGAITIATRGLEEKGNKMQQEKMQAVKNEKAILQRIAAMEENLTQYGERLVEMGHRLDDNAVGSIRKEVKMLAERVKTNGLSLEAANVALKNLSQVMEELKDKYEALQKEVNSRKTATGTAAPSLVVAVEQVSEPEPEAAPIGPAIKKGAAARRTRVKKQELETVPADPNVAPKKKTAARNARAKHSDDLVPEETSAGPKATKATRQTQTNDQGEEERAAAESSRATAKKIKNTRKSKPEEHMDEVMRDGPEVAPEEKKVNQQTRVVEPDVGLQAAQTKGKGKSKVALPTALNESEDAMTAYQNDLAMRSKVLSHNRIAPVEEWDAGRVQVPGTPMLEAKSSQPMPPANSPLLSRSSDIPREFRSLVMTELPDSQLPQGDLQKAPAELNPLAQPDTAVQPTTTNAKPKKMSRMLAALQSEMLGAKGIQRVPTRKTKAEMREKGYSQNCSSKVVKTESDHPTRASQKATTSTTGKRPGQAVRAGKKCLSAKINQEPQMDASQIITAPPKEVVKPKARKRGGPRDVHKPDPESEDDDDDDEDLDRPVVKKRRVVQPEPPRSERRDIPGDSDDEENAAALAMYR